MNAPLVDPIIARSKARLRVAAELMAGAVREVEEVRSELQRHPAFRQSVREERRLEAAGSPYRSAALNPVRWLAKCCDSVLEDSPVIESADHLRSDAAHAEEHMRLFIETEARDVALFARRRKRAAAAQRAA